MLEGNSPLNLVFSRDNSFSDVSDPMQSGMGPVKGFPLIHICTSFFMLHTPFGKGPVMLLNRSSRFIRLTKFPIEVGIVPVRLFSRKSRRWREVSNPMLDGIAPLSPFSCKYSPVMLPPSHSM
eukprot:UC4_evm3s893